LIAYRNELGAESLYCLIL